MTESLKYRKAMLAVGINNTTPTTYNVDIDVVNTLPILTMEQSLVTANTIDSLSYTAPDPTAITYNLYDPTYDNNGDTKRFVFITESINMHTYFHYSFFYDKLYKDIVVLPGLDTMVKNTSILSNGLIVLSGYRLGTGKETPILNQEMILGTENKYLYNLPLTKENIDNKLYIADFMGFNPYHNRLNSRSYTEISAQTGNIVLNKGFIRDRSEPVVLVDLGKASDLFDNYQGEGIPLYMVYQQSISRYSFSYLGIKNPMDYHIYVCLQF